MSSTRVRKVSYTLEGTATYAAGVLTVVTAAAHGLLSGNTVNIVAQNSPQELIQVPVTVTNTTTFTVAASAQWTDVAVPVSANNVQVTSFIFNTGNTGRFTFTAPRGTGLAAVLQSFIVGTGGASYTVDGSLDGSHWTNIATVTHTSNDIQSATVSPAWAYLSINITSIGTATSLQVAYSA